MCPNCSAEVAGQYCSACGQQRIEPGGLSARHFFNELADELITFRVKFKTIRSALGVLAPGYLTVEYLAGRRQRHLSPIKLYFVCAAVFFLAAPFAGFTLTSLMAGDPSNVLAQLVAARETERGLDPEMFNDRFDLRVQSVLTLSLGVGALVVALALNLFSRGALPFGTHVVFGLHYFSFLYLVTAASGAGRQLGLPGDAAAGIAVGLIALYGFIALRRVYPGPLPWLLLQSAGLLFLTMAFNFWANYVAIRLTLALV